MNCWFCNRNQSVSYALRNSFICCQCEQYNGFSPDGGYNREIPEQHYAKLNPVKNCVFSEENVYLQKSNGLCYACNRNQELKVLQLAAFVPESGETYDLEVEQYRDSLEKAYRLCARCERVVKRSLNKVKSHFVTGRPTVSTVLPKQESIIRNLLWIGLALALVNFVGVIRSFRISRDTLETWFGAALTRYGLKVVSFGLALRTIFVKYAIDNPLCQAIGLYWKEPVEWMSQIFETENGYHDLTEILNISGTIVAVMLLVMSKGKGLHSGQLLLWSFSTALHNHKLFIGKRFKFCFGFHYELFSLPGPINSDIVAVLELSAVSLILILTYISFGSSVTFKEDNLNRSFHKICPQLEEESDGSEDLNDSASFMSSSKTMLNSTVRLNHSFLNPSHNTTAQSDIMSVISKSTSRIDLTSPPIYSPLRQRAPTVQKVNPFLSHMNLDCPTPRARSIVSPPKLNHDMVAEPSWVGGGFWNTSSPMKKQHATDFIPIMSRTSSQSSGFESRPFSRENSVTKELEIGSVFSEPVFKPQPVYPPQRFATTPVRTKSSDLFNPPQSPHSLYYGSSREWQQRPQRGSIFNFKKFSNDLPQL